MNTRLLKYIQTSHILAAVAEEGSFSKAATILGVHQTAVSHRVKSLEDALGIQIFKRTTRHLTPTTAGKLLCDTADSCINEMQKTYNRVSSIQKDSAIRLSTVSSVAMKWFLTILPEAKAKNIDLSLHVQDTLVDLTAGEADVALRFGLGPYTGLHHLKLCPISIQPVASPGYLAKNNIDPTALGNQKVDLLVDKVAERQPFFFRWAAYFQATDNPHQTLDGAIHLDRTDLALNAAINGLGIALGRSLLIEEDIANGFLVPIDKSIEIKSSYWLVCTHDFARTQKYKRLEKWMKEKIHSHFNH